MSFRIGSFLGEDYDSWVQSRDPEVSFPGRCVPAASTHLG